MVKILIDEKGKMVFVSIKNCVKFATKNCKAYTKQNNE